MQKWVRKNGKLKLNCPPTLPAGGGRSSAPRRQLLTSSSPRKDPNCSTFCSGGARNEFRPAIGSAGLAWAGAEGVVSVVATPAPAVGAAGPNCCWPAVTPVDDGDRKVGWGERGGSSGGWSSRGCGGGGGQLTPEGVEAGRPVEEQLLLLISAREAMAFVLVLVGELLLVRSCVMVRASRSPAGAWMELLEVPTDAWLTQLVLMLQLLLLAFEGDRARAGCEEAAPAPAKPPSPLMPLPGPLAGGDPTRKANPTRGKEKREREKRGQEHVLNITNLPFAECDV